MNVKREGMGISRLMTGIAAGLLLGVLAVAGTPPEAQALSITYSFTGTVSGANSGVGGPGGIAAGDALSGSYSFESTTPSAGEHHFAGYNALTSLTFTVGDYTASFSGSNGPVIQVNNNPTPWDWYLVESRASTGLTGPAIGTNALNRFRLILEDSTGAVFSTALTLPTNLALSDFSRNEFLVGFFDPSDSQGRGASGNLDSLTCTSGCASVPEPTSLLFLGLGLVALGIWRRSAIQA